MSTPAAALADEQIHEWTREEYDFIGRIARAVSALGLREHAMWLAFGACSNAWGPRSAPSLGCLLALVREAWAASTLVAGPNQHPRGYVWWSVHGAITSPVGLPDYLPLTEAEALVACLEGRARR